MSSHDVDVIVIGGGLTGLAAAHDLMRRGLRVEVIEAAEQPGGVIQTRRCVLPQDAGEVLFEAGPNSATDSDPAVGALLDALNLRSQCCDAQPHARRYLLRDGRLHTVPAGPLGFAATPLFSLRAKRALLAEPFVPPRGVTTEDTDESVASFVRRRLGQEWLDYAVEPLLGGIYAGDPERLSMAATLPQLAQWEREHGTLLRGALAASVARWRARRTPAPRGTSFNFTGGMQTLTDALARQLPRLLCATRVDQVTRDADGQFIVRAQRRGDPLTRRARALLLAVPAHEAGRLATNFGAAGAAASAALAAIPAPPVATVSLALPRAQLSHPLDGFGFLAPGIERPLLLGTLFVSSLFRDRAPTDVAVLTSFVGGTRDPAAAEGSDAALVDRVLAAHALLLGRAVPLASHVQRWPRAIPQTDLGHAQRLATVDALEAQVSGLHLAGSWRDGVSIAQCIAGAARRAAQVAATLPAAHDAPAPRARAALLESQGADARAGVKRHEAA